MKFINNTDDDDTESLYEGYSPEDEEDTPKEPSYPRTDPRYWEQPEGRWEHLRPFFRHNNLRWWIGGGVVILLLLLWGYIFWFTPYVDDAVQYGYVEHVERRGVMDNYEGTLIPYKSMHDTTRAMEPLFRFSAPQKLGSIIARYERSGIPVRVEYRTYRSTAPWRGENKTVIVRVDSVEDRSLIMPQKQ